MSARDDYPVVFNLTKNISTADQANAALDEIDRLRAELAAAKDLMLDDELLIDQEFGCIGDAPAPSPGERIAERLNAHT